jgi:allantoinase
VIIRAGNLALPGSGEPVEADIVIENGSIVFIGEAREGIPGADEIIDARGLLVLPGCIDPHVHFDEPGYTWREDFFHGSSMAASGGVTTVIDMPCTSVPPVTNRAHFEEKLGVVGKRSVVDFGLFGGVSAQSFEEGFPRYMEELAPRVFGFKTYFISGMKSFERLDHTRFREVLARACALDLPVLLHAEDYDVVAAAGREAIREGKGPRQYYRSRPEHAELAAVQSAASLAREVGARLHIVHIGTADAVQFLGEGVTGETCPHYLAFDLGDFERMGSVLKCTPPVKSAGNRDRLWEHLCEGRISFVASDHAPCTVQEKSTGSIWTDYAGMPGTGLLFPYLLSKGYLEGRLGLARFLEVTAYNAACLYGIRDRKGSIAVGKDGDLVLVDPDARWTVRGERFLSKGHLTPFEGVELRGRVEKTILRGTVVYDAAQGITVNPGYGMVLEKTEGGV